MNTTSNRGHKPLSQITTLIQLRRRPFLITVLILINQTRFLYRTPLEYFFKKAKNQPVLTPALLVATITALSTSILWFNLSDLGVGSLFIDVLSTSVSANFPTLILEIIFLPCLKLLFFVWLPISCLMQFLKNSFRYKEHNYKTLHFCFYENLTVMLAISLFILNIISIILVYKLLICTIPIYSYSMYLVKNHNKTDRIRMCYFYAATMRILIVYFGCYYWSNFILIHTLCSRPSSVIIIIIIMLCFAFILLYFQGHLQCNKKAKKKILAMAYFSIFVIACMLIFAFVYQRFFLNLTTVSENIKLARNNVTLHQVLQAGFINSSTLLSNTGHQGTYKMGTTYWTLNNSYIIFNLGFFKIIQSSPCSSIGLVYLYDQPITTYHINNDTSMCKLIMEKNKQN